MPDVYERALARLDDIIRTTTTWNNANALASLTRAMVVERQSAESGGITDEKVKMYEATDAALAAFVGDAHA